jgi:hypothetical protein
MSTVRILNGAYRSQQITNQVFTLVKGFRKGTNGHYVTVKNDGQFDSEATEIRVKVDGIEEIEFTEGNPDSAPTAVAKAVAEVAPVVVESDEEVMNRMATRFAVLDEMSKACIEGSIRSIIVTGPPGVGKSFGVEQQLEKASLFDKITGNRCRFEIAKGAVTALGLYALLYRFSDKGNVIVMDDLDVWNDELSLNILKGALDSGKRRKICWNSDSSLLRKEGIPDSFEFKGSVIFITNVNFNNIRSKKMQDHLEALQSRCHFLNLAIETERDKMLRIHQVHRDADGGLFAEYDFEGDEADQILNYMKENAKSLREVSMRAALKIADLIKIRPTGWQELAKVTCCK